jgi:hypothetical protein
MNRLTEDLCLRGYHLSGGWDSQRALRIAFLLGEPQGDIRDPRIARVISPQTELEANPNTLSGRYGFGPFPMHTDTAYWRQPARLLLLRCVNPGSANRHTTLIDTIGWRLTEKEKRLFCNEPWKTSGRRGFLCTVTENIKGKFYYRFDKDCMSPITRGAHEVQKIIQGKIEDAKIIEIKWRSGDLLIIDNWRCLHGRAPVVLPDPDRELERILIAGTSYEVGFKEPVAKSESIH